MTIHSKTFQVPVNIAAHTRIKEITLYDTSYGQTSPIVGEVDIFPLHNTTQNCQVMIDSYGSSRNIRHQSKYNGTWGTEDVFYSTTPTLNTWYRGQWVKKSSSQSYYWLTDDGTLLGSLIDNTDPPQGRTTDYLTLGARGIKTSWDWVFVRKYVSPEPAFSSAGAEEILALARSFGYVF
jgi:hypothetical protein